ncbi:ATP-dependent DNA helicase RRM3-like [Eutrema salsugineum]|uniref:ATP-dependent DNA helicase RRM3-like n=1 Tax=Eutrema salsugineum TaxID=72664 RepID=UPI000CED5D30|nr:ATP-dependent DNA helicase RRM3-like [Eutrema salsugineum]
MAWMECNKEYEEARSLTYVEFPHKFVFDTKLRKWKPRKKGKDIGRITYVPMSVGEAYYLRLLLNIVIGPTCFEHIRTVKGHHYDTFKDVCYALGLLDNDKEYIQAIKDANLRLSTDQVKNFCLAEIEMLLRTAGNSLTDFSPMSYPEDLDMTVRGNPLIRDERSYDRDYLRVRHDELFAAITEEQRLIYDEILEAVYSSSGGRFFVYGSGGTGKTYLWSLLGTALRSKGHIVLNVASSGIAALLLQGGRTAHSRFAIPIVLNHFTTCAIKSQSNLAELIDASKLIIWDEALMMSRDCYETLDRTLKDILKCDKPFGGQVIVFGGDFRKILPVIPNAGNTEILMFTLNSSPLWFGRKV